LGLVADLLADDAPLLAELTAELTELVRLPISEVMESRPEPVAVDSSDDRDAMTLPASLVMELTCEDAAELMELRAELIELERDEMAAELVLLVLLALSVLVVVWAEARATKAARKAAERMLTELMAEPGRFM